MADQGDAPAPVEHLNIKVTDNNNEVFFKIKRSTQLKKLMDAFCERQGKQSSSVRFLFDGTRVRPEDTPDTVCDLFFSSDSWATGSILSLDVQLIEYVMCSSICKTATLSRCTKSRLEARHVVLSILLKLRWLLLCSSLARIRILHFFFSATRI